MKQETAERAAGVEELEKVPCITDSLEGRALSASIRPITTKGDVADLLVEFARQELELRESEEIERFKAFAINEAEKLRQRQAESELRSRLLEAKDDRPKVVCFCGSTRFTNEMLIIQWEYAKRGIIVHTWHALPSGYCDEREAHVAEKEGVKELLDELHKRKIDLSDEVFVLNLNGYIGESTRGEIEYALSKGVPVKYLEPLAFAALTADQEDLNNA